MERLEPKKGRSPISSLKFERRSDFKKFLKFIKNETEELKGIVEPKRNKVKSILGVGTGLGIFGLGAFLLGGRGDDEFEKGERLGGGVDLFAAIGRRNVPGVSDPKRPLASIKLPGDPRLKQNIRLGTRTRITRERTPEEAKSAEDARRNRLRQKKVVSESEQIAEKERAKRGIKKRLTQNISRQETRSQIVPKEIQKLKGGQGVLSGAGVKDLPERPTSKYSDYGSRKRFSKPKTSFPKTNVKFYGNMGFQKFFGGTRIGKVRPKPGFKIDPLSGDIIQDPNATSPEALKNIKRVANKRLLEEFARVDPEADAVRDAASKTSPPPDVDDFYRGQKYLKNRKKPISRRFKNLRKGVMGATDRDPSGRVTDTLSKRNFPEKGSFAKFTRRFLRGNPKITKDRFLGISYKGPKFSMLSKLVNNPAAKVVFFGLDLYNAIRSGKQIFNPRDNLGTALYDLYVSIHNTINKDNPENLKEYYTIPSDERIFKKQFQRNMSIIERRNDAARQKFVEAQGTGSNNIIVIPQNQQSNNTGGGNNTPITTGGTEISFVPPEPLNIGDDILLHKLNA